MQKNAKRKQLVFILNHLFLYMHLCLGSIRVIKIRVLHDFWSMIRTNTNQTNPLIKCFLGLGLLEKTMEINIKRSIGVRKIATIPNKIFLWYFFIQDKFRIYNTFPLRD